LAPLFSALKEASNDWNSSNLLIRLSSSTGGDSHLEEESLFGIWGGSDVRSGSVIALITSFPDF